MKIDVTLTKAEYEAFKAFLDACKEDLNNSSCKCYVLKNTPANKKLVKAALKYNFELAKNNHDCTAEDIQELKKTYKDELEEVDQSTDEICMYDFQIFSYLRNKIGI